jgi:hypothetical protein
MISSSGVFADFEVTAQPGGKEKINFQQHHVGAVFLSAKEN